MPLQTTKKAGIFCVLEGVWNNFSMSSCIW